MESLKIIFSKSKNAIFLSHIDTIKIFEEAFIKADIKVEYNDGKSQKTLMSFADPLPKFTESIGEIASVKLIEKLEIPYFIKQMNKVLPNGITVLNAEYIPEEDFDIMDRVYGSTYLISFIYDEKMFSNKTPRQIEEIKKSYQLKMNEFLDQDRIMVLNKSKLWMGKLDIKSDIINFDFTIDGSLEIAVCSGLRKKIDPSVIMKGYNEYINENLKYNAKRIKILYK